MNKNYETIRFGDLATFRNGLNFTSKSNGKGCRFIGVSDFKNRHIADYDLIGEINPEGIAKEDDYLKKGDILFVRSNGNKELVGRSLYINSSVSALYSGFCIRARISSSQILPEFCAYFAKTDLFKKYISYADGTNINNLNQTILSDVKIPLLPLFIQNSIVKVLSNLTSKIELNNRINAELEAMAKLVYEYWFVQFDFPISPDLAEKMGDPTLVGKPYKSSGGKMVWDEELKREIPEEWCSEVVGNLLQKEPKSTKVQSSNYNLVGTIPVIDQSTDFICGYTDDENARIITNEPRIVFGDHTRILKFINFDFARGADGTQILLSNDSRVPQHYFYNALLKIDLSNYGYARHFKFLKDSRIVVPSLEVGLEYEEKARLWYDKIRHNIFENIKLSSLRDWLLPMLMNGQVSVAEAEERMEEELGMVAEERTMYNLKK